MGSEGWLELISTRYVHLIRELLNGLKVSVDGQALAFIEDQQAPTYIHNSVVVNGSEVVVR